MIDEDTSKDNETRHTREQVNFLALDATGVLSGSSDELTNLVDDQNGTVNADIFVLGNSGQILYNNYGQQDYAQIIGFDESQGDQIQLAGIVDNYYLGSSPFVDGSEDQAIFLQTVGTEDELVGIVKQSSDLDLNSNSFVFV